MGAITELELNAVRDKLEQGESLGLLVQSYNNQFRLGGSGVLTRTIIEGDIGLPLAISDDNEPYRWRH